MRSITVNFELEQVACVYRSDHARPYQITCTAVIGVDLNSPFNNLNRSTRFVDCHAKCGAFDNSRKIGRLHRKMRGGFALNFENDIANILQNLDHATGWGRVGNA